MRVSHSKTILVAAPASSANLGPGFDLFAVALAKPEDRLRVEVRPSQTLRISIRVEGDADLPSGVSRNVASAVAQAIARAKRIRANISMTLYKRVRTGVGLGSSAASAVASTVAMNRLFDLRLKDTEAVGFSGEGERVATGALHYDNVSAALLGGFVIVGRGGEKPVRFRAPRSLELCVVTPEVSLPSRKTEFARSLLPREVALDALVDNVSWAAHFVSGLALADIDMIGNGMHDRVVEQARKTMVPGHDLVRGKAIRAGAAGVCISGAGPSMLALVDSAKVRSQAVLKAMISGFRASNVRSDGFVTRVGNGVRIIGNR